MDADVTAEALADTFERDGHCWTSAIYDAEALARVNAAVDAVLRGEYETGVPPFHPHQAEHLTQPLVKIDNAQFANRAILDFISATQLGEWAARATGAKRVKIWSTQLLVKRPVEGAPVGGVGWHRDENYWGYWTPESELFTAWVALSDVQAASGPMCMVPGSQRWEEAAGGNFFDQDLDAGKAAFSPPSAEAWREVPVTLPPGAVSFHDKRTIHGSYHNTSATERRSFALHMCTENAAIRPDAEPNRYVDLVSDPQHAPVIWDRS